MVHVTQSDVNRVVAALPYGKQNAITRAELVAATGMSDRAVRRCIDHARALSILKRLKHMRRYLVKNGVSV